MMNEIRIESFKSAVQKIQRCVFISSILAIFIHLGNEAYIAALKNNEAAVIEIPILSLRTDATSALLIASAFYFALGIHFLYLVTNAEKKPFSYR